MTNVINLFGKPTQTPAKDVSNESYFFTFMNTKFHFGGGAFTRDLLERLDANREAVQQLIENDIALKHAAIANAPLDDASRTMIDDVIRLAGECSQDILDELNTPNDVDGFLSDDATCFYMPLLLAATIYTCYVPFDLMRMQRANWCLIEGDAEDYLAKLHTFFTTTDKSIDLVPVSDMDKS